MPSLVLKFAFLVVDIGRRKPQILAFFQKLALFTKSLSISFWFDSERFRDVKNYSKGFCLSNVHILAQKFAFISQKRTLGLRNFRFYKKNLHKVSGRLFLYAYIVVFILVKDGYWSLLGVQMKDFQFFGLNPLLRD